MAAERAPNVRTAPPGALPGERRRGTAGELAPAPGGEGEAGRLVAQVRMPNLNVK